MEYRIHGFRHGDYLVSNVSEYKPVWEEVEEVVDGLSEEAVVSHFRQHHEGRKKSVSPTLNDLFKMRFEALGWRSEAYIFAEEAYRERKGLFRLDFAKEPISIEVAFNHGNDAPWNLLKPTLASELNHVKKDIQTEIGVIITATDALKAVGGFDSAVGSYEKYISFLRPMGMLLTAPLVIVGLEPFSTFRMELEKVGGNYYGHPVKIEPGP